MRSITNSKSYYFKLSKETDEKIQKILKFIDPKAIDESFKFRIGVRREGKLPVFYKHFAYKSVKEIKEFYSENKGILVIMEENGTQLTWDELKEELIDWNRRNPDAEIPYEYADYYVMHMDAEGNYFIEE